MTGAAYGITITAETVVKVDHETGTRLSVQHEPIDAVDVAYMAMAREKRDNGTVSHAFTGPFAFVDLAPLDMNAAKDSQVHWSQALGEDEKDEKDNSIRPTASISSV